MSAPHVGDGRHRVSFDKAVSWPTAFSMLRKLRRSMGERDRGYRLMNEEV